MLFRLICAAHESTSGTPLLSAVLPPTPIFADEFVITVEYWPAPPPPPPPPPPLQKKKGPVFKRAHRRNHERSCVSCVPYFKLLLECQFFPEMFKRVRGSFNDYVDIRLLNTGHFFLWGGWGGGYIAVL